MTTVTVPIDFRNPQVSSNAGNSFFNVINLSNVGDVGVWDFVKSVQGNIFGFAKVPHSINASPNAKVILSFIANATSGVAVIQLAEKNFAAGGTSMNSSLTSETAQNITVPGTAYVRFDVTFTLTNVPSADDEYIIEVLHNGTNGSDTLAVDLLMVDAVLQVDL